MKTFHLLLLPIVILHSSHANLPGADVDLPQPARILDTLEAGHPRLLADRATFENLRQAATQNPILGEWYRELRREAEEILNASPSRYEIPDGKRLLSTSRRVLDRVYTLALVHWLEPDRRWLDRTWTELEAAARFKDWNPSHFLDTAEMTHAFAIGYDWLFHQWSPDQREVLRQAILQHGLGPGQTAYRGEASYGWWTRSAHNWNQVCNGGMILGALALAETDPDIARFVLAQAIPSLPLAMVSFQPDGAWGEGPGYWNYATFYNIVLLAALQSALHTDFGLSDLPGLAQTGWFPPYVTGPLQRTFNFADGGDRPLRAPQMFWLARRYQQPAWAAFQTAQATPHPLDLLWFQTSSPDDIRALPLDRYFRQVELATFRSAWLDPQALFLAFKGGDNSVNHGNLDLGSFVLDALGQRWAVDPGADNYNLPGYFGNQRWDYFRMRAESHNTILLNPGRGPDQDPRAKVRLIRFSDDTQSPHAVADLTPAYGSQARRLWRGISLPQRNAVLVQDELDASKPVDLWWCLHTPARIETTAENRQAILRQQEASLHATILSPPEARFQILPAQPLPSSPNPDGQAKNSQLSKLAVHLPEVTQVQLVILLTPQTPASTPVPTPILRSLAEW